MGGTASRRLLQGSASTPALSTEEALGLGLSPGRSRKSDAGETITKSPRNAEAGDMPDVFKRLTTPVAGTAGDDLVRARILLASGIPSPSSSLGFSRRCGTWRRGLPGCRLLG